MPSRQEQLQSYQFMVQRVVSALVLRETDPPQSPFRRAVGAAFASVLITVIIAAGFGIYSVFTGGGNQKWKVDGAVVTEKNSGAVFVYLGEKLHPALNLTSALLASNSAKPPRFTVSAKSLQEVPWGSTIGIPNLPDSLVDKKNLAGYPWSVCTVSEKEGPVSAVVVGEARGRPVTDEEAMLVKSATPVSGKTDTFLLWRGRLYELSAASATRLARGAQPTPVPAAFINGLPYGEALQPLQIRGAQRRAPWDLARTVGEVVAVFGVGAEDRYVIVRENDLAWVTQTQAALAPINFDERKSLNELTQGGDIGVSEELLPKDTGPHAPPVNLPSIKTYTGSGFCSVIKDAAGNSELRADVTLTELEKRPMTARRSTSGAVYADYVVVPNGKGAIVASGQIPSAQTYSYVSRDGVRYAAASLAVLIKLGYEGAPHLQLPPELVALLPQGPGLDPTEALEQVTVS